jgi:predicted cupin superfamily sugar epimerase
MKTAQEIIASLGLKPHPIEGGYFRETYRSAPTIPTESLPSGYFARGNRSFGTAIYYLLTPETFSELHRLPTEEVFHLYMGGPVRMLQLAPGESGREVVLGTDLAAGERPQVVVPPGVWQGSALEPGADFALLGATMAPGFDYADYDQGQREELIQLYPEHAERIRQLTRGES